MNIISMIIDVKMQVLTFNTLENQKCHNQQLNEKFKRDKQ
jgi:hypothetical protein